jgi:hypothetical protein
MYKQLHGSIGMLKDQLPQINDLIAALEAKMAGSTTETQSKIQDQIRQLEQLKKAIDDTSRSVKNNAELLLSDIDRMANAVPMALAKMLTGTTTVLRGLSDVMESFITQFAQGFGQVLTDMFSTIYENKDALQAFRDFIGDMIIMMGQMCVSMGTMGLLLSVFMPMYASTMGITAGGSAAILAAGTAAIALGTLIKGKGSAGSTSSSASGSGSSGSGSKTIFLEPFFQRNTLIMSKIDTTLVKLDGTLNGFETKSPGVLVKEGAAYAKAQLTQTVVRGVTESPNDRRTLASAVFGAA